MVKKCLILILSILFLASPADSQRRNKPSSFKQDNVGKLEIITPLQFQYNGKNKEYVGKVYYSSEGNRLYVGDVWLNFFSNSHKKGTMCNKYSIDIIPQSNYKNLITQRLKSTGDIEIYQILGRKFIKLYDKNKNEELVLEAADYDFNQIKGTLDANVIMILDKQ